MYIYDISSLRVKSLQSKSQYTGKVASPLCTQKSIVHSRDVTPLLPAGLLHINLLLLYAVHVFIQVN